MKQSLIIILLLLAFRTNCGAQEKLWSAVDFNGFSFTAFADSSSKILKNRFFFREEWVRDIRLGNYPSSYSLNDVLTDLFRTKSLFFFTDRYGNIVITKDFPVSLPGENGKSDNNAVIEDYNAPTLVEIRSEGNVFIEIGNPAERNFGGKATISGYITDKDTKQPIAGVTVFNQKYSAGTISNEFGFYIISLPRGSLSIQFSFIGMKEKSVNISLYGTGELNLEMQSTLIPLKETVVSAKKASILQRFEVGVEKINLTSFRLSPTSLGEADIVKSVLLIPGVKSVGEGSQGFNVRGGTTDQNLILLNGAPLYNVSHFFGFFSAVNPSIISDVTLYKGGIPSRFGSRISSVLDIGTSDGNSEDFHGNAGISPLTTQVKVEGPVIKDTLTYSLAARTTYSDWIFRLLNNSTLKKSSASFYDLNLKITYNLNKANKLEFNSYMSHDKFRFGSDTLYRYDNNVLSFRWRHYYKPGFFHTFTVNNSHYTFDVSGSRNTAESFLLSHAINSTDLKTDFNWLGERNEINFGTEIRRYSVMPGSYLPAGDSSHVAPDYIEKDKGFESAVYFEDKFRLTEYLSVNAGIRISSFFAMGPGKEYRYSPGFSKSPSSVTDTLDFRSGQISKIYGGPEFRFSLNFRTSANNSLKINYNTTRQYIHLLSNTTSISPTDTWKICDYNLKPQSGNQVGIGFYHIFPNNSLEVSSEVYYKRIKNMADFKGGTNLVMNHNIEQDLAAVEGKSWGLELLMKKTQGKLLYSVGYTYSRTFIRNMSTLREELINDGNWFPSNFDKPHDLIITLNYLFSRRFSFSANYTRSTGRPVTYPVATYNIYDNLLLHYSDRNKYRIPDYSRLDLAFNIAGSLKLHKIANPNWTFSVYNLLGRKNVYSVYFKREGDDVKGYQLSVFAYAIPSVTFSFDF